MARVPRLARSWIRRPALHLLRQIRMASVNLDPGVLRIRRTAVRSDLGTVTDVIQRMN